MKKELRPFHDHVSCDVCGRTILKGERTEAYLAPGRGAPPGVRALFRARGARGLDPRIGARRRACAWTPSPGAARPLFGRLRRKASEPHERDYLRRPRPRSRGAADRGGRPTPRAPAREATGSTPRARRPDHGRGQGRSRARAVQLLRASAHGGRARAQPGRALGRLRCPTRRPEHRHGAGGVGAVLVSLPGRPRRRGRARGAAGAGRRARWIDEVLREWNAALDAEGRLVIGVASE